MSSSIKWVIGVLIAAVSAFLTYLSAKSAVDVWAADAWRILSRPVSVPTYLAVALLCVAIGSVALLGVALQRSRRRVSELTTLGDPDADGLYRHDGRPFCPECRRIKHVYYYLTQLALGGAISYDLLGNRKVEAARPSSQWRCTVCGKSYTQS